MNPFVSDLLDRIEASPSAFHVVGNMKNRLLKEGYRELSERVQWEITYGGKYFVVRNDSSIIAFRVPKKLDGGFSIAAAHSDSPTFKIKENAEKRGQHYVQLNTEKYGGMLMSTWFDRPLSVAGRIFVRKDGRIVSKLVNIDRDLTVIPSLAIHMNRKANDGFQYQANIDTIPLFGEKAEKGLLALAAEAAGVDEKAILGNDLFLYCRTKGTVLGADNEYLASPKLDDLECAFGCMEGFLSSGKSENIAVCCVFDNEEVGSSTKQGAASTMLRDTLRRISLALGMNEEMHQIMIAKSFLVSADNAHAIHPNHPEFSDAENCPYLNRGVVIKYNANQRYATDGRSSAIFRSICNDAGVPVQEMANRSDLPGGSTLGSIASTLVPVSTVDIGLPQLAMHSAYETAGTEDYVYLIKAMSRFFETKI